MSFKGSGAIGASLYVASEVAGWRFPRRHARKYAVPIDQRVHQRRSEMSNERREQQQRQNGVRRPQHGIERSVMRQDPRQFQRPREYDRIAGRRQHRPADERHGKHQRI